MSLKDILVYLDPTPDSQNRVELALSIALKHGSTLTGMDASSNAAFKGEWLEKALTVPDNFASAIKSAGIKGSYRSLGLSSVSEPHDYAHYFDLIVAPSPGSTASGLISPGVPEEVLLTAGVPVLLTPDNWQPRKIGENIAIAWKSSREATRALRDAMPLLRKARKVVVFTYAPRSGPQGDEADLAVAYLGRHGIDAQASTWPGSSDMTPVDAFFACLDTQDVDLIVSGAYGHSRLLEGLFGGVSRDLARQTAAPVLMSH